MREAESADLATVCFSEGSASPQVLVIANRTSAKSRFSCPVFAGQFSGETSWAGSQALTLVLLGSGFQTLDILDAN